MKLIYYRQEGKLKGVNIDNLKEIKVGIENVDGEYRAYVCFDKEGVYIFDSKWVRDIVNEELFNDENLRKLYNSNIVRELLYKQQTELIYEYGLEYFKEFVRDEKNINEDLIFERFNSVGVRFVKNMIDEYEIINGVEPINLIVKRLILSLYLLHITRKK